MSGPATSSGALSCRRGGGCVIVGGVTDSAGRHLTLVERWRHSRWSLEPAENAAAWFSNQKLAGVSCTSPSDCTAVESDESGSAVEVWSGVSWSAIRAPSSGITFSAISCLSITACTIVGSSGGSSAANPGRSFAEFWNGHTGSIEQTANPTGAASNGLSSVSCTSPTSCTAVGSYIDHAATETELAEHWNGSAWTIESVPRLPGQVRGSLHGIWCTSQVSCIAVGQFDSGPGCGTTGPCTTQPFEEEWDGTSWTIQSVPMPADAVSATLSAVSCWSGTACRAVGSYEGGPQCKSSGLCRSFPLVESWDGASWKVENVPNVRGILSGISCTSADACVAAGEYYPSTGNGRALAEAWNGISWTIQSTPAPAGTTESTLSAVSCTSPLACTAVGQFAVGPDLEPELPLAERLS